MEIKGSKRIMKQEKIIVRNWSHNTKAMLLLRQILKIEKDFREELQRRKVFDPLTHKRAGPPVRERRRLIFDFLVFILPIAPKQQLR
jgi:hypothetical protein